MRFVRSAVCVVLFFPALFAFARKDSPPPLGLRAARDRRPPNRGGRASNGGRLPQPTGPQRPGHGVCLQALPIFQALGGLNGEGEVLLGSGRGFIMTGNIPKALEMFNQAL